MLMLAGFVQVLFVDDVDLSSALDWTVFGILIGVFLVFFLFKYVAAYALWYRPYTSVRRAVLLSLCAIFVVYACLAGADLIFTGFRGRTLELKRVILGFWDFNIMTYGLPYLAAACVGWRFAHPAPDAGEHF